MLSITVPEYEISHSLLHENSHLQHYEAAHINAGMNMQQRMAIARERAGLTQKELAEKVYRLSGRKLDQAVISNLERGKAGSSKRLPDIARACGVSTDWLTMGEGDMIPGSGTANVEEAASTYSTRTAPVISWVQAGEWSEAVDLHEPGYGDGYEPVPSNAGQSVFWLRVVGDSMTSPTGASIPEGHLILVDPDGEPVNGSLVIAKLEDSQEVTFKKLVIDAGHRYLKPLNPAYPMIPINGNCRIVGVVTEAKIKF